MKLTGKKGIRGLPLRALRRCSGDGSTRERGEIRHKGGVARERHRHHDSSESKLSLTLLHILITQQAASVLTTHRLWMSMRHTV